MPTGKICFLAFKRAVISVVLPVPGAPLKSKWGKEPSATQHIKSWHTNTTHSRAGQYSLHGFFMASRRQTCQERLEKRTITSIGKVKEMII